MMRDYTKLYGRVSYIFHTVNNLEEVKTIIFNYCKDTIFVPMAKTIL